jgi:pilus assembly protein Flp/PilA
MLARIRERLRQFIADEQGPTAVEYAVMLALIILVCIVTIQILGSNTNKAYDTAGKSLGKFVGSS